LKPIHELPVSEREAVLVDLLRRSFPLPD
jgi:hypothetical protein